MADAALNLLGDVASGCLGGIDDGLVKPDLDGEVAADVDEVVDFEPGEDRGLGAHMKPPSVPALALQHVRSLTQKSERFLAILRRFRRVTRLNSELDEDFD